tara:strand:+ start:640 stop:879 length:240 start_codon:yes stop_codon:yes gene_type:complete
MTKKLVNGTLVDLTQEEEIQRQEEIQTHKDFLEKNKWLENRKLEYPSMQECIHALLDGGNTLTELQEKRQTVKNKYPKP